MEMAAIGQVRSFNRLVTERVGALNDRFLGKEHSLGEARLLWEIGAEGSEIRRLRGRLGLDSAYVSRLLRSLERQGLVAVEPSAHDRRVRRARLTTAGLAERAEFDRLSDAFAWSVLEPLSVEQRAQLVAAMAEVERLLLASLVTIDIVDPASAEAVWCIEQYFAELNRRFDIGFDPDRSISADADELTPPSGVFLLARLRGEAVGCGALKLHPSAPAEVKRMWVAPAARGLGAGRRLLDAIERYAANENVTVLHLETNRSLSEAITLYRRSGYTEVAPFNDEPYAHHWFEKRLV